MWEVKYVVPHFPVPNGLSNVKAINIEWNSGRLSFVVLFFVREKAWISHWNADTLTNSHLDMKSPMSSCLFCQHEAYEPYGDTFSTFIILRENRTNYHNNISWPTNAYMLLLHKPHTIQSKK